MLKIEQKIDVLQKRFTISAKKENFLNKFLMNRRMKEEKKNAKLKKIQTVYLFF